MKILIAALAAVTTVTAIAAPAAAAPYDRDHGRYEQQGAYNLNKRQAQLNTRIEAGLRRGVISGAEAADLRNQSRVIARLEARYRANGLTARERADLDYRFDKLDANIAREAHDRDFGQGYGHRR